MSAAANTCEVLGGGRWLLSSTFGTKTKTREAAEKEARRFCAKHKITFPNE